MACAQERHLAHLFPLTSSVGWTIFTFLDLFLGLFLLDMLATSVAADKLPRLRRARTVMIVLLLACGMVLLVQIARHYGWRGR
jgi:hypothetical protein